MSYLEIIEAIILIAIGAWLYERHERRRRP